MGDPNIRRLTTQKIWSIYNDELLFSVPVQGFGFGSGFGAGFGSGFDSKFCILVSVRFRFLPFERFKFRNFHVIFGLDTFCVVKAQRYIK